MTIAKGLSNIDLTRDAPDDAFNVSWGGNTQVGSALVVIVAAEQSGAGGDVVISTPVGKIGGAASAGAYSEAISINRAAKLKETAFVKLDAAAEDSVDIAVSRSVNVTVSLLEYTGVETAAALDETASDTGLGTLAASGTTAATAQADEVFVVALAARRATSYGNPSGGYTKRHSVKTAIDNPSSAMSMMVADRIATATEATGATSSISNADWVGLVLTLKADATPPSPPATTLPDAPPLGYAWLGDFDNHHAIVAGAVEIGPPSDSSYGGHGDFTRQGSWQVVDLGGVTGRVARGFVLNDDGHVGLFARPVDLGQGVRNPAGTIHGMFRYPTAPPAGAPDALVLAVSPGNFGGIVSGHTEIVYIARDPNVATRARVYIKGNSKRYLFVTLGAWVSLRAHYSLGNPAAITLRGTDEDGYPLPGFDEDTQNALSGEITGSVTTTGSHGDTVARWGMGKESSGAAAAPFVSANGGTGWTWDEDNFYVARGTLADDPGPWLFEDPPAVPPAPTITSISPTTGEPGDVVTIVGTGFNSITQVQFVGASALFTVVNSTQITAIVPGSAETGKISVTNAGGTAVSGETFTVETAPPPPPPPGGGIAFLSHFRHVVLVDGRPVEGARVRLYARGSVDPDDVDELGDPILTASDPGDEGESSTGLWDFYENGASVTSIISDSSGVAQAWGDVAQSVDIVVDDNNDFAHRPGDIPQKVAFAPFLVHGELRHAPETINAGGDASTTLILAKSYTDDEIIRHLLEAAHEAAGGGGGGGAPTGASYFVAAADGTLTDERVWATGVFLRGAAAGKTATPAFPGQLYAETDGSFIFWRGNNAGDGWEEIGRGEAGVRLAQLVERAHTSLTSIGVDDHHPQVHSIQGDSHISAGTPGQFLRKTSGSSAAYEGVNIQFSVIVLNPTAAIDLNVADMGFGFTATFVRARREGGTTATVNARHGASEFLAADLAAGAGAWASVAADQNQAVAADADLQLRLKSVSGGPTQVSIQVVGRRP